MLCSRFASWCPTVICASTLALATACNRQESRPTDAASAPAQAEKSTPPTRDDLLPRDEPAAEPTAAPAPDTAAPTSAASAEGDARNDGAPADAEGSPARSTTGGSDDALAGPADDPSAKIKALMSEIGATSTSDERALAAAQEALDLGGSEGSIGRAVNRRAARLFKTPERAEAMYQWSRERYTNSAAASFELAKLACMAGDIDGAKALLQEVKERGGDKQLQTISFDPTFSLVVNDSDVQALLK